MPYRLCKILVQGDDLLTKPARLAGEVGVLGRWAADMRKIIEEPISKMYYGILLLQ